MRHYDTVVVFMVCAALFVLTTKLYYDAMQNKAELKFRQEVLTRCIDGKP